MASRYLVSSERRLSEVYDWCPCCSAVGVPTCVMPAFALGTWVGVVVVSVSVAIVQTHIPEGSPDLRS